MELESNIRLPGGGALRHEGSGWVLDKYVNRKRHRLSSNTHDLSEALTRWRRQLEGATQVRVFSCWPDYRERFLNAQKSARKRNLEFTLTEQDCVAIVRRAAGRCEITGIHFRFDKHHNACKRQPFAPSVDRIDSSRGYVPDNVRLVCLIVNYAMMQWGEDALKEMAMGMIATGMINIEDVKKSKTPRPNRQLLASISNVPL